MNEVEELHKKIANVASSMFYGRRRSEKRDDAYGWLTNFIKHCGAYLSHSKFHSLTPHTHQAHGV
jgi:hypothetical protein